jgi:hypothetical protein
MLFDVGSVPLPPAGERQVVNLTRAQSPSRLREGLGEGVRLQCF